LLVEGRKEVNYAWKRWFWVSVLDSAKRRIGRRKGYEDCLEELSRSISRGYDAKEIFPSECAEDLRVF